jgi:hypothetical protein
MVCSCRVPIETYPENAEWGPLFWKLLHGLAEYSGKQRLAEFHGDERRSWISLLNSLQATLPCDICRGHYKEWLVEHPVEEILTIPYSSLNLYVRSWLWTLHNRINEGNDKPLVSFESLETMYKGVELTQGWKALEPVIKKAISLNGISLVPWRTWLGHVRRLQSFYL